ncbi:MAG: cytochrome P450 [Actinomycetota bacterium]|nr:cytochrome P450 [Actinomycetota bacterium]
MPPGPRAPVLVQTMRYLRDPFAFLESCQRRYGRSVTIELLGFGKTVWVTDQDLIKEVFSRDDEMPLSPAGNLVKPIFGTRSVTGLDGHAHLNRRKLLLPRFHGEAIAGLEADFRAATERTIERWSPGDEIELHPEMYRLTMDFLFETLMSVTDRQETERLTKASMELMAMMSMCAVGDWIRRDLGPLSPWAYFLRRRRGLDRLLYAQIASHRDAVLRGDAPDDILTMLIEARFDDDTTLNDNEIRDELVTLIVAGSETTATSMAWTFDLVMHRPGAVARIISEAAVGEHAFTDAAIKESLRLRPPVIAAGRVTNRTVELGPWIIPEGVRVWTPMSLIQRDPEVYEHPNEFRPERFLESKPPAFMWIPFGGGVRRCLAAPFALLEMRVVVQTVLSRLRLAPLSDAVERTRAEGAIIVPARGVRVRLEGPRETAVRERHPLDELLEASAPAPARVKVRQQG